MVLSFVKNNSVQNATSEIFIHTDGNFNQSDFTLTVLLPEKAFCSKVSGSSPFVITWSQRLKLTPEEYVQQLLLALQRKSKHRHCQNGSMKGESASSNDANEEHVFQVEKSVLTWKQYFPDKQIYGKRGAIPLEESNYSSTVWELLQESVLKHTEAQDQIDNLEKANSDLKQEVVKARALADESLRAKDKFQQQSYAKFCALINSKKEKIRQLEEALQNSPGPSSAPDACTSGATSSSVTALAVGKRRPITVISHGGAAQNQGTHNSDDEYDDDTDVDDASKCDTDEENEEIKSRNHVMGNAREKISKNREISRRAATGSKREAPDESSQSCKKASLGDSQDDLFNSSVEGASLALLSSIKPRETTAGKVSCASSLRSPDNSNVCRGATTNNVSSSRNSPIFLESRRCTEQENIVGTVEDDPASVVARILRKNALMRKANGIDMPRRVDEFDVLSSGGGSAGVEIRQRAINSDLKMSWALEAADEKSARSPFLGDAGNCNLSQNTRSSVSDMNASVPVQVDECEPIAQLVTGRIKESTVNDVNQSSELNSVDKGSSLPADSKDVRQGSSSKDGGHHNSNDQENELRVASNLVPKYEVDTQLSSERDPESDDSVVILYDTETNAPANVASCQLSTDKCVEEKKLLERSSQNTSHIEASNPLSPASSEISDSIGVPKINPISQCNSQASKRPSKRCGSTPRAPRKKTRVLERDLIEHNFRSGSVIEEILM